MRRLEPGQLLGVCDPAALPFTTTADLTPLDGIIGQERAVSAMEAGIGIRDAGYHMFVLGRPRDRRAPARATAGTAWAA